jgi:hypothetical protein
MENKVTEYKTVVTKDIYELEREVQQCMHYGWQPVGGITTAARRTHYSEGVNVTTTIFIQAMVK